ncbi:hypothetical protein K2X30_11210 [bacterium]|nr:hypothetical protein [bacterium]
MVRRDLKILILVGMPLALAACAGEVKFKSVPKPAAEASGSVSVDAAGDRSAEARVVLDDENRRPEYLEHYALKIQRDTGRRVLGLRDVFSAYPGKNPLVRVELKDWQDGSSFSATHLITKGEFIRSASICKGKGQLASGQHQLRYFHEASIAQLATLTQGDAIPAFTLPEKVLYRVYLERRNLDCDYQAIDKDVPDAFAHMTASDLIRSESGSYEGWVYEEKGVRRIILLSEGVNSVSFSVNVFQEYESESDKVSWTAYTYQKYGTQAATSVDSAPVKKKKKPTPKPVPEKK